MDEKERNQFVDDLLDASLARYGSVTPRPGLEGRILANAKAAQARRSWFVWAGWLAAGATAALIVIGIFSLAHRRVSPAPPSSAEAHKTTSPIIVAHTPEAQHQLQSPVRERTSRRRVTQPEMVPVRVEVRQPVFPSPSPVTEQEKLLAQYVRKTPPEAQTATPTESALIPDLEIKPLEIAPLDAEETEPKIN